MILDAYREKIERICREHHVQRLDVFGSAAREYDFDPERSDVDLWVVYEPDRPRRPWEPGGLQLAFEEVLGRKVDIITAHHIANPYLRAGIEKSRRTFYRSDGIEVDAGKGWSSENRGVGFMAHDPRTYLLDIRESGKEIEEYTRNKTYDYYMSDRMLRRAVERDFQIIGEALSKLSKEHPEIAKRIGEVPQIVAFRNILVHGYREIDHERVWGFTKAKLPELIEQAKELGAELDREYGGPQPGHDDDEREL